MRDVQLSGPEPTSTNSPVACQDSISGWAGHAVYVTVWELAGTLLILVV